MEFKASMGLNTSTGHGDGPMTVEFEDGQTIILRSPKT